MSKLLALISKIESVDNLNIVSFDFFGTELKMMSLELKSDMKVGKKVLLSMKPTSVAIAKNFTGDISFSNKIKAKIESIDMGELLCNVKLSIASTTFESIITVNSAKKLDLKIDEEVTAFIKASELSISEVLDD
jgi:molybdopterin-binding protein